MNFVNNLMKIVELSPVYTVIAARGDDRNTRARARNEAMNGAGATAMHACCSRVANTTRSRAARIEAKKNNAQEVKILVN